jgi:hypothetical protein
VAVLHNWSAPKLALHLVTPAGGPRPIRVAVLLEFLTRRFRRSTMDHRRVDFKACVTVIPRLSHRRVGAA